MSPAERAALVQGAVDTIRAEEGANHCRGRYYAREYDATFWQKLEAEKIVRQAEREKARQECVYCHHPIPPGEIDEMLDGIDAPEPIVAQEAA